MNPAIPPVYVPGNVTLTRGTRSSLLDTGCGTLSTLQTLPDPMQQDFSSFPLISGEYGCNSEKTGGRSTYDLILETSNQSDRFEGQSHRADFYRSLALETQHGGPSSDRPSGPSLPSFDIHLRPVYLLPHKRSLSPGLSNHSYESSAGNLHPTSFTTMEDHSDFKAGEAEVSHHQRKKPCLMSNLMISADIDLETANPTPNDHSSNIPETKQMGSISLKGIWILKKIYVTLIAKSAIVFMPMEKPTEYIPCCHFEKNLEVLHAEVDEDSKTCSSRSTVTPPDESSKKQNHSEIEKRRRNKMNRYITELAGMLPICSGSTRKLDKLTVLTMAVQHMRAIRGTQPHYSTDANYKPSYISDPELKQLILQGADGFLFVVGCDRGKLLYVSESVTQVLNYSQGELLGQSWFDILHPQDVVKVKEQLNDLAPRERLFVDIRTMLPVKGNVLQHHWGGHSCPGARRSFFCRMKCKSGIGVKQESSSEDIQESAGSRSPPVSCSRDNSREERKYKVIYCMGYMQPWPKTTEEREGVEVDMDDSHCNLSCLVAVGRIVPQLPRRSVTSPPLKFTSRHAPDGRFVYVDQRATPLLGFLPQEVIGTSMYDFYHQEDSPKLAQVHKLVLSSSGSESMRTPVYRFRISDSTYISLQSDWKVFRNPWTREVECLIATNTHIDYNRVQRQEELRSGKQENDYDQSEGAFNYFVDRNLETGANTSQATTSHPPLLLDKVTTISLQSPDIMTTTCPVAMSTFGSTGYEPTTRNPNNESRITLTTLTSSNSQQSPSQVQGSDRRTMANLLNIPEDEADMLYLMGDSGRRPFQSSHPAMSTVAGNEEAAMGVIMSLLESEAGVRGPSALPWSLS